MTHSNPVNSQPVSFWFESLDESQRRELHPASWESVPNDPDVLILDDGVIGLAVAYFAAEKGFTVQVLTTQQTLGLDSMAGLGLIAPNALKWSFNAVTQGLGQASRDWWAKLSVRPEFQMDWRVSGALMTDSCRLIPNARIQMLQAIEEGYTVFSIDAEQVRIMEPALGSHSTDALHYPSDAQLNPLKAVLGLIHGIARHQGRIHYCSAPIKVQQTATQRPVVETVAGTVRPRWLIVNSSTNVLEASHSTLKDSLAPVIESRAVFPTHASGAIPGRPILARDWVVPTKSGDILAAISVAPGAELDADLAGRVLQELRTLIPAVSDVTMSGAYRAVGRFTRRGIPVLDALPGLTNTLVYDGFGFDSLLFAPIAGKLLVDWICADQRPEELQICRLP